jgi:hypothetical protein
MSDKVEPTFSASEQVVLDGLNRHLRAAGWAEHVTVEWLLKDWRELSLSVAQYPMTVDDYTNDLTTRDGLEIVLAQCPEPLRAKLKLHIQKADSEFLVQTQEDAQHALESYFRINQSSGWWWRRIPVTGSLAIYLTQPG